MYSSDALNWRFRKMTRRATFITGGPRDGMTQVWILRYNDVLLKDPATQCATCPPTPPTVYWQVIHARHLIHARHPSARAKSRCAR